MCTSRQRDEWGNLVHHETFESAIQGCNEDENCHGVFDWKCDGRGENGKGRFQHCISEDAEVHSNSCVYEKTGIITLIKFSLVYDYRC